MGQTLGTDFGDKALYQVIKRDSSNIFASLSCQIQRKQLEIDKVDKILEDNVAEAATAEWVSPIVLAPKKDGSLRFWVIYSKLTAVTVQDSYPIPRMDECTDCLGTVNVFSTMDANSSYQQTILDEKDVDKTAFVTHNGLFWYTRMLCGLKNAPATFWCAMDFILAPVKWQHALVYVDNVVIFSRTPDERLIRVESVLQLIGKARMTLKL